VTVVTIHGICSRQRDNLERCFVAVDGICCRETLVGSTAEVQVRDPCTLTLLFLLCKISYRTFILTELSDTAYLFHVRQCFCADTHAAFSAHSLSDQPVLLGLSRLLFSLLH